MNILKKIRGMAAYLALALVASACGSRDAAAAGSPDQADTFAERGAFSGDSAMAYASAQVAFGPRTPGSVAHDNCTRWLASELSRLGADTVRILESQAVAWDGNTLPVKNIFAQFNPGSNNRVILLAHYDTRPWADQDADIESRERPIDGANDGASGVAVLLEVARNLGLERPEIGVDILLTDCEDYGARSDIETDARSDEGWCLGAKHFADNLPYTAAQRPRYGILLDMVGARGARFNREYLSAKLAPGPTAKVWAMARRLKLDDRFPMEIGGAVTDDHLPLIQAGIPVTDIIENASRSTGSFPASWHTHDDNIDNLDPEAMAAAGRVVLNVIYNEKP